MPCHKRSCIHADGERWLLQLGHQVVCLGCSMHDADAHQQAAEFVACWVRILAHTRGTEPPNPIGPLLPLIVCWPFLPSKQAHALAHQSLHPRASAKKKSSSPDPPDTYNPGHSGRSLAKHGTLNVRGRLSSRGCQTTGCPPCPCSVMKLSSCRLHALSLHLLCMLSLEWSH